MIKQTSRFLVFLLLAAGLLSSPTGSKAQEPVDVYTMYFPIVGQPLRASWIGPFGGRIAAIAVDPVNPATVYIGSFGAGVFKSVDGGDSWSAVNSGLPSLFINALAVDPVNPAVVYAGPYQQKLYKSTDGGNSWFSVSSGIQDQAIVYSIAIDPQNTANVYISTRGIPTNGWAPWNGIVYKSRDAGASWSTSLDGIGGSDQEDWVYALAINPETPNIVFAASHEHGPYRSEDYGDSWESIDTGISDGSGREIVIVPHTSNPGIEYMGVWHWDAVYKSYNDGNNWAPRNQGVQNIKIFRMVIDPQETSTVYATALNRDESQAGGGIYKTEDAGKTWNRVGMNDQSTYVIGINPANPDLLITGTLTNGVWKSTDAGENWHHSQTGVRNTSATGIVALPGDLNTLVASTDDGGGISVSADQGKTWSTLNTGLGDRAVRGLVANPANPALIYALTQGAGLYRYDLAAKNSWVRATSLLLNPRQAAVPQSDPASEAGSSVEPLIPGDPGTLEESTGALGLEGTPLALVFSSADPNVAYVGTGGNGVYRSADNAKTWQTAGLGGKTVGSLAVHPTNPDVLYAVSGAGSVQYSDNRGASWTDTGLSGLTINALSLNPANPDTLYAGTNAGIYSRGAGGSWAQVGLADKTVTALAVPAGIPGVIYAGTTSGAAYSTDGGATWNPGPWELQGVQVQFISIDPNNPHWVYFGTKGQGTLRVEFP